MANQPVRHHEQMPLTPLCEGWVVELLLFRASQLSGEWDYRIFFTAPTKPILLLKVWVHSGFSKIFVAQCLCWRLGTIKIRQDSWETQWGSCRMFKTSWWELPWIFSEWLFCSGKNPKENWPSLLYTHTHTYSLSEPSRWAPTNYTWGYTSRVITPVTDLEGNS